jgi:hypothetical protein
MAPGERPIPRATVAVAIAIAALAVLAVVGRQLAAPTGAPTPTREVLAVENLTGGLGTIFHPGAPQGFGENGSAIFLAGIGVWDKPVGLTLPVLATLDADGSAMNVTGGIEPEFHDGGVFGAGWNGTSWLVSGEATWGNVSGGVLLAGTPGHWTNLSPRVGPEFRTGGVWAVGWNGTSWLLAGNDSRGAVLVSYADGVLTNLTDRLTGNSRGDWIQLLAWNGSAWMMGGKGIFAVLTAGRVVDLLPDSPFVDGGVFAADWNGSAWLVGGGSPAATVLVRGATEYPGPALAPSFSRWVNSVVWVGAGWIVAGKGAGVAGVSNSSSELGFWPASASNATVEDLSALLPGAFADGQVQFTGLAPMFGPSELLVVGQGHLDPRTGASDGALALLFLA